MPGPKRLRIGFKELRLNPKTQKYETATLTRFIYNTDNPHNPYVKDIEWTFDSELKEKPIPQRYKSCL